MFPRYSPLGSKEASSLGQRSQGLEVTPELVRKIADLVYAALQRDLAIERERSARSVQQGGRALGRGTGKE